MPDQMDYDVLGAHKVAISGVALCGGYPPLTPFARHCCGVACSRAQGVECKVWGAGCRVGGAGCRV